MLTKTQLNEIRNHLEASQNPLFFFDNDVDGLCAFLILRRAINRGKGVAIKSFPDLKKQYLKKVDELNPDAIFILDKAELNKEFTLQKGENVFEFTPTETGNLVFSCWMGMVGGKFTVIDQIEETTSTSNQMPLTQIQ